MNLKKLFAYLPLLSILLLTLGCESQKDHHLRVNIGAEPASLDPRRVRDLQSQSVVKMFFEGLTRLNAEDKSELALADRMELSSDGKTYTFHLRQAYWTNGDSVTANDFAYAWKKVLDPNFPSDQAFQMYVIKNAKSVKEGKISSDHLGITVVDDHTIQIELEHPIPYFLDLLASNVFYPVHQKTDEAIPQWASEPATFIGNGPFKPSEWKHNDKIEVIKNPRYWDAKNVKLAHMELVMVSEQTELAMFENKELDLAGSPLSVLPVDALPKLKQEKGFYSKPFLATYFLRVNTYHPPINHSLMRKALAVAINRQALVDFVLQGNQIPATGLVPTSMAVQQQPYFADGDGIAAKKLFNQALKELDMNSQVFEKLRLVYVANDRNRVIAQAIQHDWQKAFGVSVQLEPVERKVYFDRISSMNYDIAIGSWTADYNDPLNFLEVFKNKANGTNNTGWENAQYAAFLDRTLDTVDPADRIALLRESQEILMQEMPVIPVFHYTMLYMQDEKLHNIVISSLGGIDFKWAYVE